MNWKITKLGFSALTLCLALNAKAQPDSLSLTATDSLISSFEAQMDHVFDNLDLTDVTTNLLLNRSYVTINVENFTGEAGSDTVYVPENFMAVYGSLGRASTTGSFGLPAPNNWRDAALGLQNSGNIPIPILHYDYHCFKNDSALINSLIYENNGQLYDYPSQSTTPYEMNTAFVAGLYQSEFYDTLQINFKFDNQFIFDNTGKTIQTIQADFGAGQGLQTISLGESIPITYPDFGDYTVQVKITYTDASVKKSYSQLQLKSTAATAQPQGAFGYNGFRDREHYLTSGRSQNLGAVLQIEYGCGNHKLLKPFILVEGYNPDQFDGFRGLRYDDFFDAIDDHDNSDFTYDYQIAENMQEAGYDIVYIDFDQGAGDIRENAYVLMAAINWINQEKAANGSDEPNVLWGQSMGGLIGRFALRRMEIETPGTHEVKYYISHDTPHLGANVPLGYQLFLADMYSMEIFNTPVFRNEIPDLQRAMDVLDLPASRQLLRYSVDANPGFMATVHYPVEFNSLQAELSTQGLPQETEENIAIANGNGVSRSQGFSPGQKMFHIFKCEEEIGPVGGAQGFWNGLGRALSWISGIGTHNGATFEARAIPYQSSNNRLVYHSKIYSGAFWGLIDVTLRSVNYELGTGYIPFDAAPGGTYDLEVFTGGNAINTNDFPCPPSAFITSFTFVPTVSALNITSEISNPYYFMVDENQVVTNNKTTFDRTHILNTHDYQPSGFISDGGSAENNELHFQFTPSNADVFEEYLVSEVDDVTEASSSSYTIDQETYNFGENTSTGDETFNRTRRTITIKGTSSALGKLCVNCNDRIRFTNDGNNPQANTNAFELNVTDGCSFGGLIVDNYGVLEIGTDASKTAKVYVRRGAYVRVKSGGKVIVRDASLLNIDEGAQFIFEEGALLELPDYGSVLKFQGKLSVGADAEFTFSGNGKLVFDQDVKWVTDASGAHLNLDEFWSIGNNAKFTVLGSSPVDYNRQLILAEKTIYLRMEDNTTFSNVRIENGRVALNDGVRIYSYSPTILRFVNVNGYYSWTTHEGFRLFNNSGPNTIFLCKFSEGNPAAQFNWTGGGPAITLTGCEFSNNEIGLKVKGGSFNVNGGDFDDNYEAIHASNLTGNSIISTTTIDGTNNLFQDGVYVHSQNGAFVNINDTKIINCRDGISLGANISSRVHCSDIQSSGRYGILAATSSSLDIGEHAENIFASNINDIYITGDPEQSAIYLDNGYNDFAQRNGYGHYLIGRFSDGQPTFLGGVNQISADNNKMPTHVLGGVTYMPVDFTWKPNAYSTTWTNVTLNIPNNLTTVQQDCRSGSIGDPAHTGHYRFVESLSSSGGVVSTGGYGTMSLKDAALDAIDQVSFGEELRNDGYALANLIDILESPVSGSDNNTAKIQAAVYQQMHQALNNAYQYGILTNVQGEGGLVGDTLQDVIDLISQYINNLNLNDSTQHFSHYRYNLDQAYAYRVGGYYDQAISVLQSLYTWTYDSDQQDQANYWLCVCTAESQYYDGTLPAEEFTTQMEFCNNQFYGNNYKRASFEEGSSPGYIVDNAFHIESIEGFPQPALSTLTVSISPAYLGDVRCYISDLSGKALQAATLEFNGNESTLEVNNLKTGVYLLTLEFESGTKTLKFSKK